MFTFSLQLHYHLLDSEHSIVVLYSREICWSSESVDDRLVSRLEEVAVQRLVEPRLVSYSEYSTSGVEECSHTRPVRVLCAVHSCTHCKDHNNECTIARARRMPSFRDPLEPGVEPALRSRPASALYRHLRARIHWLLVHIGSVSPFSCSLLAPHLVLLFY